jgi:hypothetical protein
MKYHITFSEISSIFQKKSSDLQKNSKFLPFPFLFCSQMQNQTNLQPSSKNLVGLGCYLPGREVYPKEIWGAQLWDDG